MCTAAHGVMNTLQFKLLTTRRVSFEPCYSCASGYSHIRGILSDYNHVRWFEHQRILLFAVVFRNIIEFVVSFQSQPIFVVLSRNRVSVVLCSESHFRGPLSKSYFCCSLPKFHLCVPHFRISFSRCCSRILFSRSSF